MVATTAAIAGQTYQLPPGTGLLVSPTAGTAATAVAVTGGGCTPATTVTISFRGQELGRVRAGQAGEFSTTVILPAVTPTGRAAIVAVGAGCHESATFTLQSGGATLSPIGTVTRSTQGLAEVVAGLAIMAVVLVEAVRRRRRVSRRPGATRRRRPALRGQHVPGAAATGQRKTSSPPYPAGPVGRRVGPDELDAAARRVD